MKRNTFGPHRSAARVCELERRHALGTLSTPLHLPGAALAEPSAHRRAPAFMNARALEQ